MEISNLLDAELKTLVIRMVRELSEDLNYKRRLYSAHTKGTLQVPSMGDRVGHWTL